MPLRGLALLVFVVGSLPVCFVRPFYGVVLWTIIAFVNPQSYSYGFDSFPWAAAVAVPTIVGMVVFDRNFQRLASRQVLLMTILWIWFTTTSFVSTNTAELAHHAADTWDKWQFVSKMLLMTLCMIPIVSSFQRLRYLVLTIAASFGLFVAKSLPFIVITGGNYRLFGPDRSMIADNNDFGLALNMTLPLYFCLAQTETAPWMKRALGFLFLITLPAILFTYSRGALIGLIAVVTLMFLQSRRRWVLVPVMALGLAIGVSFAPEAWQQRMNLTSPDVIDVSALSRLHAWAFARALATDYPITGGGFATFTPELYDRYTPSIVETIYGPHSIYFQVLGEHGFVGLALYLTLIVSCLASLRRMRKEALRQQQRDFALYTLMFQLSIVAFLVSGTFLGRAYFDYFFTIIACVVVLEGLARERLVGASGVQVMPTRPSMPPFIAATSQAEQLPATRGAASR